MPVGMVAVGRLSGKGEAHKRHHVATAIGEVVKTVRHYGNYSEQRAHDDFERRKANVKHYTHRTCHFSDVIAHGQVVGVFVVFDK